MTSSLNSRLLAAAARARRRNWYPAVVPSKHDERSPLPSHHLQDPRARRNATETTATRVRRHSRHPERVTRIPVPQSVPSVGSGARLRLEPETRADHPNRVTRSWTPVPPARIRRDSEWDSGDSPRRPPRWCAVRIADGRCRLPQSPRKKRPGRTPKKRQLAWRSCRRSTAICSGE